MKCFVRFFKNLIVWRAITMVKKKETKKGTPKKQNHKKATFQFMAPEAQSVLLAGDFNSWNPEANPLKKASNGLWKINVNLSPGRYEYRFLVDGQWQNDPGCESYVANPFGEDTCVIKLG
jgi:1,4-alpha-glucan branching enzyme